MSVAQNRKLVLAAWSGPVSFIPLVILGASLYLDQWPFEYMVGSAIAVSFLLSLWFCFVGLREKMRLMPVWILAFVFLIPVANIAFWLIYRRRESRRQG